MSKVVRAIVGTALSLCLVTALGFAGAPRGSSSKSPVLVGDFAIQLADAMNVKHDGTPAGAKKALGDLGIQIGDPTATLTEGKLVTLLGDLGIPVKSSSVDRPVTGGKAEAVVKTFQRELRRAAGSGVQLEAGGDDFNNGNGKGGKFKRKANLSPGGNTDD